MPVVNLLLSARSSLRLYEESEILISMLRKWFEIYVDSHGQRILDAQK